MKLILDSPGIKLQKLLLYLSTKNKEYDNTIIYPDRPSYNYYVIKFTTKQLENYIELLNECNKTGLYNEEELITFVKKVPLDDLSRWDCQDKEDIKNNLFRGMQFLLKAKKKVLKEEEEVLNTAEVLSTIFLFKIASKEPSENK